VAALLVGVATTVVGLVRSLDYRGWTTRQLTWFYRHWPWLWFGSERSYVTFNRFCGWFVVAVGLALVVASLAGTATS
jgi:hypothetical protein